MHFLIRMALVAAAGAAAWRFVRNRKNERQDDNNPKVVYLDDEDAVIDAPLPQEEKSARATVKTCYRRMDPLTLNSANEAVFTLEDDADVKLHFSGEGGLHLLPGDQGVLTWADEKLLLFEKDNGEVIGGMFYMSAGEAEQDE